MNLSTRRRLLKTGFASAFVAASGVSVAAGARRGGCLRLALDAQSVPHFGLPAGCDHEFADLAIYAGVFETLVEIAPDGMLRGELAERWRGSPDGRVWTIHLRDGVRFHDGTPLTAGHASHSLEAQRGSWALQNVACIDVTGRLEVTVKLSAPDTGFPFLLANPEFAIRSNPAAPIPQGTGPYRVADYRAGDRLISERFEQAHTSGAGHFDRVEVLAAREIGDRLRMLQSGRVDALAEFAPFRLPRRFSLSGMQAKPIKDARFLVFDLSRVTGDDLRDKVLSAVDSEALVRDLLHGHGRPVIDGRPSATAAWGPPVEIGVARGLGFDETAAQLVAGFARTFRQKGVSVRAGYGADGTIRVRWVGHGEATMLLDRGWSDQAVILSADAVSLVSLRLQGPARTGGRFPLDDTRIARRWRMA